MSLFKILRDIFMLSDRPLSSAPPPFVRELFTLEPVPEHPEGPASADLEKIQPDSIFAGKDIQIAILKRNVLTLREENAKAWNVARQYRQICDQMSRDEAARKIESNQAFSALKAAILDECTAPALRARAEKAEARVDELESKFGEEDN